MNGIIALFILVMCFLAIFTISPDTENTEQMAKRGDTTIFIVLGFIALIMVGFFFGGK